MIYQNFVYSQLVSTFFGWVLEQTLYSFNLSTVQTCFIFLVDGACGWGWFLWWVGEWRDFFVGLRESYLSFSVHLILVSTYELAFRNDLTSKLQLRDRLLLAGASLFRQFQPFWFPLHPTSFITLETFTSVSKWVSPVKLYMGLWLQEWWWRDYIWQRYNQIPTQRTTIKT